LLDVEAQMRYISVGRVCGLGLGLDVTGAKAKGQRWV